MSCIVRHRMDYILHSEPQQCGPARFLQWKRSIFTSRNMSGCTIVERALYFTANYTRRLEFDKELLSTHGVYGEIARDVVRTYQNFEFFGSTGKLGRVMLLNILCAVAEARPDVGYCQVSSTMWKNVNHASALFSFYFIAN